VLYARPVQFGVHRRLSAPLSASALAVALLTGCGSSPSGNSPAGTVSATRYVAAVCTSVASWYRGLQTRTGTLSHEVTPRTPPAAGKKALESFLALSVADTETAAGALRAAGVPNVSNGTKIARTLVGAFEHANGTLKGLSARVAAMPASNSAAVSAEVKHVSDSVQALPLELGSGFAGLNTAELDKAAAQSPTCKSVGARPKS
jgi:hypothetical protein